MSTHLIGTTLAAALLAVSAANAGDASTAVDRPTPPAGLDGANLAAYLVQTGCPRCLISGRDLSGQTLDGADLTGASFDGTNLAGASLRKVRLDGGHITMSALDGAAFTGASMQGLTTDCTPYFVGMQCTGAGETTDGVDLSGANLRGAHLDGIPDLVLDGATAEGATFAAAFPPSLAAARFDTVYLAPGFNSGATATAFSHAEIEQLAPHVKRYDGSWEVYSYDLVYDVGGAASFDCAKASSETEKALCTSGVLGAFDRLLGALYTAVRKADPKGADDLKQQQLTWLKQRNACGGDVTCLHQALERRITELANVAAAKGAIPAVQGGTFRPVNRQPGLPAGIAGTDAGKRLVPLLSNDGDTIKIATADSVDLVVDAFAMGGNGHMCSMESELFSWSAATGGHVPPGPAGDGYERDEIGWLIAAGDVAWLQGGQYWCGARATLTGLWLRDPD